MNFTFIRIMMGFPSFLFGTFLPTLNFAGWGIYSVGCFMSLMGSYIISRSLKYETYGIGWLAIGAPMFFFSMLPDSWDWLLEIGISPPSVIISRVLAVFIGGVFIFSSLK